MASSKTFQPKKRREKAEVELDLTVVYITYNAERYLAKSLASLPRVKSILLVDSGSTDQTRLIAERHGAEIIDHAFINFSEQRNFALDCVKTEWVLMVDSDEVISYELRQSLVRLMSRPMQEKAYRLSRRLVFMGRKLRFGRSTDHPVRLFRAKSFRYRGDVHEELIGSETLKSKFRTGRLHGELYHYSYYNLEDYFEKFNRYTSLIAERKAHRAVSPLFFLRFFWEFFSRYVLRLGALDGQAGFCYALLSSVYAYVKYAKVYEKQLKGEPFQALPSSRDGL